MSHYPDQYEADVDDSHYACQLCGDKADLHNGICENCIEPSEQELAEQIKNTI